MIRLFEFLYSDDDISLNPYLLSNNNTNNLKNGIMPIPFNSLFITLRMKPSVCKQYLIHNPRVINSVLKFSDLLKNLLYGTSAFPNGFDSVMHNPNISFKDVEHMFDLAFKELFDKNVTLQSSNIAVPIDELISLVTYFQYSFYLISMKLLEVEDEYNYALSLELPSFYTIASKYFSEMSVPTSTTLNTSVYELSDFINFIYLYSDTLSLTTQSKTILLRLVNSGIYNNLFELFSTGVFTISLSSGYTATLDLFSICLKYILYSFDTKFSTLMLEGESFKKYCPISLWTLSSYFFKNLGIPYTRSLIILEDFYKEWKSSSTPCLSFSDIDDHLIISENISKLQQQCLNNLINCTLTILARQGILIDLKNREVF